MRTYVIAEIGSCHEGDIERAKRLIRFAKTAGADCAKMQFWSDGDRLARRRNAPELAETYRAGRIEREWIRALSEYAKLEVGIEFGCSTYLPEDVWFVAEHCDVLKVASFEAEDRELLTAHRNAIAAGKSVVISLGMQGRKDVSQDCLRGLGCSRVSYLHCVSAYPAPAGELGLSCLRDRWHEKPSQYDGFSDHTAHPDADLVGAIAVAAGAKIVERHVKLHDTPDSNPDAPHSSWPSQFAAYVKAIRFAEVALYGKDLMEVRDRPSEESSKQYRVRGA